MLKLFDDFFSAAVCISPIFGMGLDGAGFCRASVESDAACVTASTGDRIGNFFCTGKSSAVCW